MKTPHTAMVFAAGLGKRMQPLTLTCPKPLIAVAGRTMLDRALDHLVAAGIKRAIVNTHYLAEQVNAHLASRRDLEIILSHEPELLETGGGLKKALPQLGSEPIFVINSDIVWMNGPTPALNRLTENWNGDRMNMLLLLVETGKAIGYDGKGDFGLNQDHRLTRPEGARPYVFSGVQILNPAIFADAPDGAFSLSCYFDNPKAHGLVHDGAWLHIGTPDGLKEAEAYLHPSSTCHPAVKPQDDRGKKDQ